jgi:hypothetical protein
LHNLGIDVAKEIIALAREQGAGTARKQLIELAGTLARQGDSEPELHLPPEWDVIPTRYTRDKPE